jgi:REP element-mobilizing transposase RayT
MARANRHHLPGYVWHITHRCHKREEDFLKNGSNIRDTKWTESIAVGDKEFVLRTQTNLGAKAIGRNVIKRNGIL